MAATMFAAERRKLRLRTSHLPVNGVGRKQLLTADSSILINEISLPDLETDV